MINIGYSVVKCHHDHHAFQSSLGTIILISYKSQLEISFDAWLEGDWIVTLNAFKRGRLR